MDPCRYWESLAFSFWMGYIRLCLIMVLWSLVHGVRMVLDGFRFSASDLIILTNSPQRFLKQKSWLAERLEDHRSVGFIDRRNLERTQTSRAYSFKGGDRMASSARNNSLPVLTCRYGGSNGWNTLCHSEKLQPWSYNWKYVFFGHIQRRRKPYVIAVSYSGL